MIKFLPIGHLDINTDPSRLPAEISGKDEISGAMRRCTNLNLDEMGIAKTRFGSNKVNSSAVASNAHRLEEMDGHRYLFSGTLLFRDEVQIASLLISRKWSAIQYNAFNDLTLSLFALNGVDRKRIDGSNVNEWGITPPVVAPAIAIGAGTGLTGDYNAKYTYVRKSGTTVIAESNPSPAASAAVTLANQSLSITCTAPTDSQVTHIRIYRTLTGGAIYYYDQELTLPTVTVDSSTVDTGLGTEVEVDHDRPPLGNITAGPTYNGYCFILKDNLLYFCRPNRPEYWPSTYYVEVGSRQRPLTAIAFLNGLPYVFSRYEAHLIQGSSYLSFFPFFLEGVMGAVSQDAVAVVKSHGIYRVAPDGIYLFNGSEDKKVSEAMFDPIFHGETRGSIPGMDLGFVDNCWLTLFRNHLYFGYPATHQYPDNVLVTNLSTNKTVHHDYSKVFRCVAVDKANDRLLAVDDSGYIWHIEDEGAIRDDTTNISWQIESKAFSDQLYKYFPRSAKYDVDVAEGATANGYILLGDEIKQTHVLSGSRNTKKRLITPCTGDRLGVRISGTGPVTIMEVEVI